jgi:hypothetical protein
MNLRYKIIEVHPQEHSIVVRFYTDLVNEAALAVDVLNGVIRRCRTDYNINLPVPAPQGEELEAFITKHAPTEWLATQEALLNPNEDTSMSSLMPLVGVEKSVPTE